MNLWLDVHQQRQKDDGDGHLTGVRSIFNDGERAYRHSWLALIESNVIKEVAGTRFENN